MKGPFNTGGDKLDSNSYINAVKRNNKRIYLIAFSYLKNQHDAEDVLQDVFLKLWKTKKEFECDEHIDKWLTINCISRCKDYFRLPFFNKTDSLDEIKALYSFDSSEKLDVINSIMSLPQKERIVIHLFYYEGMSINDIADVLKANPSTVKTRLRRAKIHLKEDLGDDWINE